jgi:excisionase family DNA binding protein
MSQSPPPLTPPPTFEPLLTPAEVAAMFRVDPKTVTRWAVAGKLTWIRTLGGHRRYREAEVRALLAGDVTPPSPKSATWAEVRAHRPGLVGRTVSVESSNTGLIIVEREDGHLEHVLRTWAELAVDTEIGEAASSLATTLDAAYLGTLA